MDAMTKSATTCHRCAGLTVDCVQQTNTAGKRTTCTLSCESFASRSGSPRGGKLDTGLDGLAASGSAATALSVVEAVLVVVAFGSAMQVCIAESPSSCDIKDSVCVLLGSSLLRFSCDSSILTSNARLKIASKPEAPNAYGQGQERATIYTH